MQRLRRILEVFAWTAFFLFAAIVLALRYWLLPDIERYRPQIEARVAAAVGQPIRIGAIDAGWDGLRPQIALSDVRIYDAEGREALVLPSVENILSWRSLLHGEVRLRALRIQGPRLAIRRDAAGTLYVAGFKLAPGGGDSGFADRLLGPEEIEVRNAEIEWRDEKRGAPPLVLSALDLRVRSDGDRHAFGLVARPPIELSTRLELRGELDGRSMREASGWSGKLYAELGYTELAGWKAWVNYPLELEHGTGAVRVWAEVEGGKWRQATADVQLSQVAARLGDGLAPLRLQSLEGRLQARRTPSKDGDSYELGAAALSLAPEGGPVLPPVDFQLAWKAEGGQLYANAIELEPVALVAESLPLPAEIRSLAAELAPRGQLADLRFDWRGDIAAPAGYKAQARFAELGLRPHETLPGFARLAGTLEASERGGRLYLQSRGAEIDLPRVFPEPRMVFDTLSAQVEWQRQGGVLSFSAPAISFANADLSGNASGSYVYASGGPGVIDFTAAVTRADAKNLAHDLPLGTLMGEKTRTWLAQGILAGHASDVHLRLKGDLRDFPFLDPEQGQFLVRAHVQKGQLHYAEGWPDITDIDGELVFERDRLDITGHSGHILGARVRDVHVGIGQLGKRAVVMVNGGADGPTAEFFRFLASSPLRSGAGRFTETMAAQGDGHLKLRLELPIAELSASKVSGEYEFADNQLTLYRDLPPVEAARGRVAFTQSTFTLRDLRGRLFGGNLAASGGTRGRSLEFTARGDAQPATLEPFLDERLRAPLSGAAPYTATLTLREGMQRLVVESPLRGVTSELPPPFEKATADALPLRVDVITAEAGARQRVSVALGRVAALELLRRREADAMQLQRASLAFSPAAGALRLPERPGVLVYGSLASLDVDRWRAVMGGPVVAGGPLPAALELKIARLDALGRRFNNVAFRGTADAAGWTANVDADEIAGQLSYKTEGAGLVTARLLHLSLAKESAAQAAAPPMRAGTLPSIDFVAERFALRGGQLGRVELKAQRSGDDWRIENLAITNDDATVALSGAWRGGVVSKSEISFDIDAYDAGRFMTRLGYPGMVLGGKVQLNGALSWQGSTLAPDYASLSGDVRMVAEDGEFLEIDPGLGKLVSLMNLQALPRRIALDFRDVFSKGFRFDRIDAAARLDRGVMDAKEFRMRGPAAEVTMAGAVDVARETQNLKVRVVPSLGGAASTAVVGIVNPVAGVAAALAQAMLKNPLGQIFAYEYQVTGGWADPKVAKLTVAPVVNEALKP